MLESGNNFDFLRLKIEQCLLFFLKKLAINKVGAIPGTAVKLCLDDQLVMGSLIWKQPLCICKGSVAYNDPPPYLHIARSFGALGYVSFF